MPKTTVQQYAASLLEELDFDFELFKEDANPSEMALLRDILQLRNANHVSGSQECSLGLAIDEVCGRSA
ncbi:MAG: hypothetical protein ACE141_14430 [Bryobacteraceae bacterium]